MGFLEDLATNQTAQGIAIILTIIGGTIAIIGLIKKLKKTPISTIVQKPEFQLLDIKPNWKREENEKVCFNANLKNNGTGSASNVQVSFEYYSQEPNLRKITQEKKHLKKQYLPIAGTIIPNSETPINWIKEWKLSEVKLWVVTWVRYQFNDKKSEECAFVSHVIGDCTDGRPPIYYSNNDLKQDEKDWNDLLSGKTGL